ncbi:hypothetical protein IKG45_03575 [Candidatus Saccharibacteria bacterium]|nr:hypothetical protein [Candidatus Saccharibacteria bacterium]
MKQSDVISIVAIAVFGFIVSYLVVGMFMDPDKASVTYKKISPIDDTVKMPNPDMFNVNAINPTVEVYIGKCVDADQDGILSDAEKVECNEIDTK